jgi:Holliday junction resolvase RusA-like endonuclease
MKIDFCFKQKIVPKQRPRFGKNNVVYTSSATSRAEIFIKSLAIGSRSMDFKVNAKFVKMSILFEFARPTGRHEEYPTRSDLDNCAKLVMDALNGICYGDDRCIVELVCSKVWGNGNTEDLTNVTLEAV